MFCDMKILKFFKDNHMKKQFTVVESKVSPDRQIDAIKHEIKKYIARERRKKLPEGQDYWDFDCKIGTMAADAKAVHVDDINKQIDLLSAENTSFYVEILAKSQARIKKKK